MQHLQSATKRWFADAWAGWNRFWFTPQHPHILGLIRIAAGAMLFYTHAVWGMRFESFFGETAFVPPELALDLQSTPEGATAVWSHFWWTESPSLLWTIHLVALCCFALLTLGLYTRTASIAAAFSRSVTPIGPWERCLVSIRSTVCWRCTWRSDLAATPFPSTVGWPNAVATPNRDRASARTSPCG